MSVAREKSIFLSALECEPGPKRNALLAEACGGDEQLRRSVEELLSAYDRSQNALSEEIARSRLKEQLFEAADALGLWNGSGSQPLDLPERADEPRRLIPHFRLMEQLGEGGFGQVYVAEQSHPVRRRVAIKILKTGMLSREAIARFEAEQQALAMMDHPNIARVFDGGTTAAGQPYFVMELVRGIDIMSYCRQEECSIEKRLRLFVDVCQAVQHAHQKGVIHRDLKPSNVLVTRVDSTPVVKVIDFGVAKALNEPLTDKTIYTRFTHMVGTPMYMSPEQAEMNSPDIDTRSDIYSLGVLLYELLTDTSPFDQQRLQTASFDEMRRMIREEEPPPPSARVTTLSQGNTAPDGKRSIHKRVPAGDLKNDLDWVVMKALEKDRKRRYETAADLARDVQRFLDRQPVVARPPSQMYRISRFARRNKASVVATSLVLVALVSATVISTWQAFRATQARREAEMSFGRTRAAVDQSFTRISESDLLDVPGLEPLRKQLLSDARAYYEEFLSRKSDDPTILAELAAGHFRLGQINHALDDNDEAVEALGRGLEIANRIRQSPDGRRALREKLAGIYQGRRGLHRGTQQPSDTARASSVLEQMTALWNQLVDEAPEDQRLRNDLAGLYLSSGEMLLGLRQLEAALPPLQRASSLWTSLTDSESANPEYGAHLARCETALSDVYRRLNQTNEARAAFERAHSLREKQIEKSPQVSEYQLDLASSLIQRSKLLREANPHAAGSDLERARAILANLHSRYPAVPSYAESMANARYEQSTLFHQMGQTVEADAALVDAVERFQKLVLTFPNAPRYREQLLQYATDLGVLLYQREEHSKAEAAFALVVTNTRHLADIAPDDAEAAALLAWKLAASPFPSLRNTDEAMSVGARAVARAPDNAKCWRALALAQYRSGHFDEAFKSLEKAAELRAKPSAAEAVIYSLVQCGRRNFSEAKSWHDTAMKLIDARPSFISELQLLEKEAARLIQAAESAPHSEPSPSIPESRQ